MFTLLGPPYILKVEECDATMFIIDGMPGPKIKDARYRSKIQKAVLLMDSFNYLRK